MAYLQLILHDLDVNVVLAQLVALGALSVGAAAYRV